MGPCSKPPPTSNCNLICTSIHEPVCGTDGRTYNNQCALDIAICKASAENKKLELVHGGTCKPPQPPPTYCGMRCSMIRKPVCGSNGKTYGNKCLLDMAKCEANPKNEKLELKHEGPCKPSKPQLTNWNVRLSENQSVILIVKSTATSVFWIWQYERAMRRMKNWPWHTRDHANHHGLHLLKRLP